MPIKRRQMSRTEWCNFRIFLCNR